MVMAVGEVEVVSRDEVADGLYPSASSNEIELPISLLDNNVDCLTCSGQLPKEPFGFNCPALLPSSN